MKRILWPFIVWLPLILGSVPAPQQAPTQPVIVPIPDGLTAHLENPQVFVARDGTIFAATRPNSGVGGLVWKMTPDGTSTIVFPIDPDAMYALGELNINQQNGYLYYATVEKADHTFLKNIPVPGWVP